MRSYRMNLDAYFSNRTRTAIVGGFAVFASGGLLTSYGLFLILNTATVLIMGTPITGALPFPNTMADVFLATLYFTAALILFLSGYLLMEGHYGGILIAAIFGTSFLGASIFGNMEYAFGLSLAIFCYVGTSLGFAETRRKVARKAASIIEEKVAKIMLQLTSIIAIASLFEVAAVIVSRGSVYLSLNFLTNGWPPAGWGGVVSIIEGRTTGVFGCGPAIAGSLLVVGLCEAICVPLGLGSAIFLAEYTSENALTRIIHFFVELLAGVPSIILGIFGFTFFVVAFGWHPRSLLGGALCLAFMTLPWNIRVAEEAIKAVPREYKTASYALGASKVQTIRRIVLSSAAPGVLTGILLGFGAAFGEAAVVIFTAGDPYAGWPAATNVWGFLTGYDIPTLPAWIYGAFKGPAGPSSSFWVQEQNVAFSGAFVLVAIFLMITVTALMVRNHLNKRLAGA